MSNYLWVFFVTALVVDLFFVALRASLLHARQPYLIGLRDHYPQQVDLLFKLLENPYIRADVRVGVVVMHFSLAGSGWMLLQSLSGFTLSLPVKLASMIMASLLILVVEFTVEGLILRDIEKWAIKFAQVAHWIDIIFRPLTWLLMRLLGPPQLVQSILDPVIEDELKNWVKVAKEEGGLDTEERKLIYSIFQFGDTLCREIMIPRIDILALDVNTSLLESMHTVINSGHSRVPVYEETIDNIIGFLYVKDLLKVAMEDNFSKSVRDMLRPVHYVPEAKRVSELLREMQIREVHAVIVVDEYGGTAGLVTLEDIVEEIVGEIRDEYDQAEEKLYQEINEGEFVFQGRIDIDDFNDVLNTHLTREVADTLAGYIYGEIGRVPVEGEKVDVEDWLLIVEQISRRRIRKVRAQKKTKHITTEGEGHGTGSGDEK